MNITKEKAIELLHYIPERPDYENWVKVISAIGNHFSEIEALNILRTRFTDEQSNETKKKLRNRLKNITIGTLVYYAKENGYKPFFNTKEKYIEQLKSTKKQIKEPEIIISAHSEPIYVFSEDFYERSAILESSLNITEMEADEILLSEMTNPEKIRLFRVSVNYQVINKNINPNTLQKYNNFHILTNKWLTYNIWGLGK